MLLGLGHGGGEGDHGAQEATAKVRAAVMWNDKTVSVVLMTYAERFSIRDVIERFYATGVVDEVVVIDNNAEEGTVEEVQATPATTSPVTSWPGITSGRRTGSSPAATCRSVRHTPHALT